ncbi:hypothetical protein CLG96_00350 [Sphingomonas oleivorans]|uniref:DUF5132 domain-containing protein n=1 Tax=Sphingomonas oleivorans TaxID=1735121 RepID=A0A2T5G0I0_9SPHN|nr:DUF5132 domain-containing protein [Sphingomonas oleivorans]PTQ12657.1 hypothetical protein CLG96_00350 [Sphingomonas oleivorans]
MARLLSGTTATGFFAGIVGGLVAPALARGSLLRPAAKTLVRTGFVLFEQGREAVARCSENLSDLIAEVQEERRREAARTTQPAGGGNGSAPAGRG